MVEALGWLIERGGTVVAVLLGLSVVAATLALHKLLQLARARVWSRAWLEPVLADARAGRLDQARRVAGARPGPVARVLTVALAEAAPGGEAEHREEVERVALAALAPLEANLRGLDTIATLAPLLGLLGTVLGMIRAFARVEEAGSGVDAALLAGGIWEALLTTAVGLAVAIPVTAALAWLESQVDRERRRIEDAATRALHARPGPALPGSGAAVAPIELRRAP